MRGMLCNGRTGYVHVRAAALFEGGPHDLDGLAPFMRVGARLGVLHTADIIGIGDTDVADASEDVARHVAIAAGRLTTQVVLDVAQPALSGLETVMRDHGCDQGGVVRMLARTNADLTLPARVGKGFVCDGAYIEILGYVGDPVPQGKGVPLIVGATQMLGNRF